MRYENDTEAIDAIAAKIKQKHEDILATITELRALNDDLNAAWTGESQVEFEARFGDWIGQLEQFSGTLESVNQFLVSFVQARLDFEEQARNAAAGAA
jgi:WXG100 family type VII secretion target